MITGASAWDGARAYHLLPAGTTDISLTTTVLQGRGTIDFGGGFVQGTDLEVGVVTPSIRHAFDVGGNLVFLLASLPIGDVAFRTSAGTIDLDTSIAQGDLLLGGTVGLVGTPALTPLEFAMYKPGFHAVAEGKLFIPTGDYDSRRMLSLGLNRWSIQASLPMIYTLGDSMLDPDLMTFEVRPVVQFFGDNEDPFGPALVAGQEPIFGVEAHVTRSFGLRLWAGIDAYYETGGETSTDGIGRNDGLETFSLGATLGLVVSPQVSLRLSYRELVQSNIPESSGRTLEVATAFLF